MFQAKKHQFCVAKKGTERKTRTLQPYNGLLAQIWVGVGLYPQKTLVLSRTMK